MTEVVTLGDCTLIHGDCREVLPTLPKHDLLLTDPPYGIDVGAMGMGKGKKRRAFEPFNWDIEAPPAWMFKLMISWCSDAVVWGGNYFSIEPRSGSWLAWDKVQEFSGADFELAYTTFKTPSKIFRMARAQAYGNVERHHPTQKPLQLMAWCLGFVPDAQTILDPFMGSGTTGVACVQLGRKFTGIERERKYFDIACERISRAQAQGQLIPHEQPKQIQESLV